MNLFLVVVFYTITATGTFTKTEISKPLPIGTSLAVCEVLAKQVKVDKYLNDEQSYVFSAECKADD